MTKVDPITLSVVRGVLETTQREMTLSLEKTARSGSKRLQNKKLMNFCDKPLVSYSFIAANKSKKFFSRYGAK